MNHKNIEEALANTFICENLPGGWARVPYETCLNRQTKKEMGRSIEGSHRIFYQCLDCEQGRENIKIWEERQKMGSGKGTCGCCERPDMAFANKFSGVYVCGFCIKHLKAAQSHGVPFEEAKPEIMAEAKTMRPGKTTSTQWSWADLPIRKDTAEQPSTENKPKTKEKAWLPEMPCMNGTCDNFSASAPDNCARGPVSECDNFRPVPKKPMHDMGYPPPTDREREAVKNTVIIVDDHVTSTDHDPNESFEVTLERLLEMQRQESAKELCAVAFLALKEREDTILIPITDRDKDVLSWVKKQAVIHRRTLDQEIMALLEELMSVDAMMSRPIQEAAA